ncbi:MAG: AAA family ATPase [Alphaproteobacteria bacterium]|nr:AAA family ATPase [Alphaproteobacteria bacterium]
MSLKLRRLTINGFKSLVDFELRIPDELLVLIGQNGSGKSSLLQALAFLRYVAHGNPEQFFADRGWAPADIQSKIKRSGPHLQCGLVFEAEDKKEISWGIDWSFSESAILKEYIYIRDSAKKTTNILSRKYGRSPNLGGTMISGIYLKGSLLPLIDIGALDVETAAIVTALRNWGAGIFSLELLSPVEMRRGARGSPTDIGPRGERLAGFLASLSPAQKDRIVARLAPFYPLQGLETTRKRAGWVDLRIAEAFKGMGRIGAAHMSDGFLRLLGIASIPEFGDAASMVLLDEVEDGVDPHILPDFIRLVARESKAQLVLTSHSPVLVNAFEPDQIAFVARDEAGRSQAASFADIQPLMAGLDHFGAGEVWAMTDAKRIAELVIARNKERAGEK